MVIVTILLQPDDHNLMVVVDIMMEVMWKDPAVAFLIFEKFDGHKSPAARAKRTFQFEMLQNT